MNEIVRIRRLAVRKIVHKYRLITCRRRPLPDFIIIGARKAGTSSLAYYLGQHPDIAPPLLKEIQFFDGGRHPWFDNYLQGEKWYRSNFRPRRKTGSASKTFEKTPLYMYHPLVPGRMHELLPDVKIIALLRNPVDRAISDYFMNKGSGNEKLSMLQAFMSEEERLGPILERQDYKHPAFLHHSYKLRGLYKEQLDRYLLRFGRGNMMFIYSEPFFANPENTLRRIFDFVGVDREQPVRDLTPQNVGSRANVPKDAYEHLESYFHPHNEELYELIGEAAPW